MQPTLTPDQIAELERLAKAAINPPEIDGTQTCEFDQYMTAFYAAIKPEIILALIEEIASLERYSDDVDREGERLAKRVVELESRNAELEKALREIEMTAACEMDEKFSRYDTIYTLAHALGNCHDECPVKQEGLKKLSALSGANCKK